MSNSTDKNESDRHTTFTSPQAADMLDQIPVPFLRLLVMFGPTIRLFKILLQIAMWDSGQPRESLLLLFVWVFCCVWSWQVLTLGVPLLVLTKLGQDWLRVRTTRTRRETLEKRRLKKREERSGRKNSDSSTNEECSTDDGDDIRLKQQRQLQEIEEDTLIIRKIQPEGHVSLDDTIRDLEELNDSINTIRRHISPFLVYLDGSQPHMLTTVINALTYIWPLWAMLTWSIGVGGTLALVGASILISFSPWFTVVVKVVRQNMVLSYVVATAWAYGTAIFASRSVFRWWSPFSTTRNMSKWARVRLWVSTMTTYATDKKRRTYDVIKKEKLDALSSQETQNESPFRFEIYENQRWWLGMGWTTNMMPNERGPWTDQGHVALPPKESFILPGPTKKTTERVQSDGRTTKRTTSKTWSWKDSDWWVDMTGELHGEVDHNGWAYGNNAWKSLTCKPGLSTFTRRRRWCRRARLVEHQQDEHVGFRKRNGNLKSGTSILQIGNKSAPSLVSSGNGSPLL